MTSWKLFRIVITAIIHGRPGAAAIFQQSPFLIMSRVGRLSKLWAAPSPRAEFASIRTLRSWWWLCWCRAIILCIGLLMKRNNACSNLGEVYVQQWISRGWWCWWLDADLIRSMPLHSCKLRRQVNGYGMRKWWCVHVFVTNCRQQLD